MTLNGWIQIALFCAIVLLITRPLGGFLARLFAGDRTFLHPVLAPVERGFYRVAGVRPEQEQGWAPYALATLAFHVVGFVAVYAILRLQGVLPLNPQGFAGVAPDLALNTAVSFVTNTNWQSYGGEATMSYGSQMWALTVQNFLSAATGMALAVALVRGFARKSAKGVGNFWADLTRSVLYVLLPACVIFALIYAALGVPQTLQPYVTAKTLEGADQTIALGPVASQLAIKMLGTNGGGFFNANSAHPFENPSALSNLVQMVSIFAIGAALTNVFGRMVGDERQGWAILAAMGALFLVGVGVLYWAESAANPIHAALGLDPAAGNMEGKEVRFGIALSALFAVITSAASCGAVIAMHDSFSAIGGLVPMINMQLGEVIVGGVGAGLYGILLFAVVAVFVAGLMVGRTPEYVGKKIESREVKLTMLALLCSPAATLLALAVAAAAPAGLAGLLNQGPHGFSEMLYATTSAAANNGSAFAGLTANSPFWNVTLAVGMMIGRFALIVPMLAVAGSLAAKGKVPPSAGTFPTDGALFVGLLVGVIVIVGGLTYFPALTLGPVADAFATVAGQTW
ncbi:potassium-transporting ATPase subunit KdpA [Chelatococcus sambhunathii]|uniref:Potassium-transporting ATPase potassium-binding subunit n=1 Tax=Chelatococcus sambhunathii TaxID=363953 RepID=A0ABU1DHI0_9HYPH|nr:potassium-transporting ATPase subunit KdpA [Chelatococcus sambhunathii]MDR4307574.1 potassium-transporting ATPase subunit KdpA [Chelatococcus sambhunathii]